MHLLNDILTVFFNALRIGNNELFISKCSYTYRYNIPFKRAFFSVILADLSLLDTYAEKLLSKINLNFCSFLSWKFHLLAGDQWSALVKPNLTYDWFFPDFTLNLFSGRITFLWLTSRYHHKEQYFNFNKKKYKSEKPLYWDTFSTVISLFESAKQVIYY